MPQHTLIRAFAGALLVHAAATAAPRWPDDTWLFTSFRGKGDGLHLAASTDGNAWRDLGKVFLKPSVGSGLLRDPHILRGPDGVFRMVWTTGWKDKGIGYAASTDLVTWSPQRYLPIFDNVPGAGNAWAPETFHDDENGQYVITVSADIEGRFPETKSTGRMNNRTYYVTTKDFVTFSEPRLLFDPGFDHIDTTLVRDGGRYIAVFKEGDRQQEGKWGALRWAVADHVLGPYRLMPQPLVAGQRAEGPTVLVRDGVATLYADYYAGGRYGAWRTTDWHTWTDVSAQVTTAPGQRHGSVLRLPAWLAADLATAVPGPPTEPVPAPPPILGGYTADPAIRVFGDTYYIYPTSDKPHWQTTDFSVWSSRNLVDWKKERMVLDVAHDLKWAHVQAWAPDVIERNGRYYMYFCAEGNIGVATAPSPLGSFVDALGKPLVAKGTGIDTNTIDPYPFIDDDGQAYLYYGNGNVANVYKLKADMITLDGPPRTIALKEHREGIVVFKRAGRYYFMWSIDDARSPDYRVGWGVGDSPLGPVTSPDKDFIVLQRHGPAVATAHHSVVNVPGTDRWYAAYHRHALPVGNGYQRETVLARMTFDAAGAIIPMDPLAAPFQPGDRGEPVTNTRTTAAPIARRFAADPSPHYFAGQFYLYATDDASNSGKYWDSVAWRLYTSSDMKMWTDAGVPLDVTVFKWARADAKAWAPEAAYRNGKYYFYAPVGGDRIGVAVADHPAGPFRDARGDALVDKARDVNAGDEPIDPAVFVDKDGQAYLYFGTRVPKVVKLKADMITLDGPIRNVAIDGLPAADPKKKYGEAPFLHQKGGIYYFTFSTGWPGQIVYATGSSPLGPFTYRGVVVDYLKISTNHQAILEHEGKTWLFYHDDLLPGGGSHRRAIAIAPLDYEADGRIRQVALPRKD